MPKTSPTPPPVALILIEVVLALLCIGLIVFGVVRMQDNLGMLCLAVGVLGLITLGASLPIAWMLHQLLIGDAPSSARRRAADAAPNANTEKLLSQIYENSMLSDNAKRVLFRDRELELLRRAIQEDISHGDYNSALTLCDEMANLFGHREEAEAFRTRIHQAGHASFEARVQQALDHFEKILSTRDWGAAHTEAGSIRRLYPNHHLVLDIDQRILRARQDHKVELQDQFIEAANRNDFDIAMSLLRQLDKYLTRDEAARIAETAQSVVSKHRDNLSMQFKLAVNDHRWAEAAQFGDTIMAEYPNTKMADEVRAMIDVLRVRATQAAVMAQGA